MPAVTNDEIRESPTFEADCGKLLATLVRRVQEPGFVGVRAEGVVLGHDRNRTNVTVQLA